MQSLKTSIERLAALGEVEHNPEARPIFLEFRDALTQGKIRAAEKNVDPANPGRWVVNVWVKHGILLGFRLGELAETGCAALTFVDKDTFASRSICRAVSNLYAAHVYQRGSLRGRRHHGRFARAGGLMRTNRQARASQ